MSDAIYQVKAGGLNLRTAPASNAAVIAVMPRDTFVSVTEGATADGWLRITWNAFTGFAAGKYLAPVSGGGALPPPAVQPSSAPSANPLTRDRDMTKLHPIVRDRVDKTVAQLNKENIPFRVFEAFRAPERQADLYAQGRTDAGKIVTKAKPWESYHQYGLAADLVLFVDNKWEWSDAGPKRAWWDRMTLVAQAIGLETLSFERPHVQLSGIQLSQLQQGTYPGGGDDTWFDALSGSIARWRSSGRKPEAPPSLLADRPPLPDA